MTKRSVASVVIFSLISCGIYMFYWVFTTAKEFEANKAPTQFTPPILLVLTLFLNVVGFLIFGMAADESLNKLREAKGMDKQDQKVIYMVLGFVLPIVLVAMVQNEINKLADAPSNGAEV